MLGSSLNLLTSPPYLETISIPLPEEVGEAGGAGVERPADERAIWRPEAINAAQTKLNDVLPLIESNLTIQEVAERLGISVEAACALVVASLRSNRAGAQ